jgi:probable rRNA maturation factor
MKARAKLRVSVTVTVDDAARGALDALALARLRRRAVRMVTAAAHKEGTSGTVAVGLTLTGDARIHALNRDFRRKNKPTDVLAFAMREGTGGALHPGELGDVVISVETARRQARRGLYKEIEFLWAHGLCHLLGYDHNDDAEEAEMNARMAALLVEGARRGQVKAA